MHLLEQGQLVLPPRLPLVEPEAPVEDELGALGELAGGGHGGLVVPREGGLPGLRDNKIEKPRDQNEKPRDQRPHLGRTLTAVLRLGVDVATGAEGLDERVLGQPADGLPERHRLHEGDVVLDQQQGAQAREVDPGDLRSKSRRKERTHHGRGAAGLLEVLAGLLIDAPRGEVRLDDELGVLV